MGVELVQTYWKGSKMSKLIFLDIDGTFVTPGGNIPPKSAITAIAKARQNGHKIVLCTGRNLGMLKPLLAYGVDGIVGSAGGYVTYGEEVLVDEPMSEEATARALRVLRACDIFCTIEGKNSSFSDSDLKSLLGESRDENSEIIRWRRALEENLNIKKMEEYDNQPIYKIVMMANRLEKIQAAKKELQDEFHFMIQDMTYQGLANGELLGKNFDKGTGIKCIVEYLKMSMEDTVGFGDSMNDIEMAQVVGTAVCMENGSQALKEISDFICPHVDRDGLYKGFEMLGLI